MARSATAGTDYLEYAGKASPNIDNYSFGAWFEVPDVTNAYSIIVQMNSGNSGQYNQLLAVGDNGDRLLFICGDGSTQPQAFTTTTYTAGAPYHGLAVTAANNDRRVYLNGAGKGTSSTTNSATVNNTLVGSRHNAGGYHLAAPGGRVWEAALWGGTLTDDDAASLAAGVSPLLVRRDILVAYWPIYGVQSPELDIVNGLNLTVNGFVAAQHGLIYMPTQLMMAPFAPTAPAFQAAWARNANTLLQSGARP